MRYLCARFAVLSVGLIPFTALAQVIDPPADTVPAIVAQVPAAAQPAAIPAPPPANVPAGPTMYTAVPVPVANNPAFNFPTLPPSRPCVRQDVDGLWQLKAVHENPAGVESSTFATQPYQYFLFSRDDTYRTYSSSWQDRSDGVVMNNIRNQIPEQLQQYVVHQSGVIFFYVGGQVKSTQVCFIVSTANETFAVGQMLLMPPEGTHKGRLVKVYERSTTARSQPRVSEDQQLAQPDPAQPKKKRRKRRQPRNR